MRNWYKLNGVTTISTSLIKNVIYLVVPLSVHIFNLSLSSGRVPDNLKIGRIIPIFKKGESYSFSNYRPITLIPCFSKDFGKIVYNRLISHLNKNELFSLIAMEFNASNTTAGNVLKVSNIVICSKNVSAIPAP